MIPIGEDDMNLVKEAVLFPVILDVLERDKVKMEASDMKMKELYVTLLSDAQTKATAAFYEVKKGLRKAGIKILSENREKEKLTAEILCRGYTRQMGYLWNHIGAETKIRIAGYIGLKSYG